MSEKPIEVGDLLYWDGRKYVAKPANSAAGEVVRVIEPFVSPEQPGLVEVAVPSVGTAWPSPIPVSERLPNVGAYVLAWHHRNMIWDIVLTIEEAGRVALLEPLNVHGSYTYWLPLPPNPEPPAQVVPTTLVAHGHLLAEAEKVFRATSPNQE